MSASEEKRIEEQDKNQVQDTDSSKKRESTRSTIAITYVASFLGIILTSLIACWIIGVTIDEQKDMLVAISGILSGPLGFIVGYYFKASAE